MTALDLTAFQAGYADPASQIDAADLLDAVAAGTEAKYEPFITTWEIKPGMPKRVVLLLRISDADEGETAGVDDQREDGIAWCMRHGWGIAAIVTENDTSAYKRKKFLLANGRYEWRTDRPKYRWIIDQFWAGRYDGLVAADLDRAVRDPRDLEDLIDATEQATPRLQIHSLTGSLILDNDSGIVGARINVAIANKSSRDTARRVSRARLRQAKEGRWGGGPRRWGFGVPMVDDLGRPVLFETGPKRGQQKLDMTKWIDTERDELAKAIVAIMAGASKRSVRKDWDNRGIAPVKGGLWDDRSLTQILLRPANAGLMVHKGEIVMGADGKPVEAPWEAITTPETLAAMKAMFDGNPKVPGNKPQHLLSGAMLCGHPDCVGRPDKQRNMRLGRRKPTKKNPYPAYRCQVKGHNWIKAEGTEAHVEEIILRWLEKPESADVIEPVDTQLAVRVAEQVNALEERKASAKRLFRKGVLSETELEESVMEWDEELEGLRKTQAELAGVSPLEGLAGRPDARERWAALDLGRQKAIVKLLLRITIMPSPQRGGKLPGGKYFDDSRIVIEPTRHMKGA